MITALTRSGELEIADLAYLDAFGFAIENPRHQRPEDHRDEFRDGVCRLFSEFVSFAGTTASREIEDLKGKVLSPNSVGQVSTLR